MVRYFVLEEDEKTPPYGTEREREVSIACPCLFGTIDSYKIGPSIAMVLFQSRRVIGHWATISAVTGWEQAR